MKRSFLIVFLTGWILPFAHAQTPPVVQYDIIAELHPADKLVTGELTLIWTNPAPEPVRELYFHMYMNAFKNMETTFMRESRGRSRGFKVKKGEWGWIDVKKLSIEGMGELKEKAKYVQPDDGNPFDQTVLYVPLPQAVEPGQSIRISIDFETKLPRVFARTGYFDDFYMVAQWFPKIGVLEYPGVRYATKVQWNCHQFHANSEFYANYGTYTVRIRVPQNYIVGATGVLVKQENVPEEQRIEYTYHAEKVHDFAWTASPHFKKIEVLFDPVKDIPPSALEYTQKVLGLDVNLQEFRKVRMILLMQPEHMNQLKRHIHALKTALTYFGLWYAPYPYETITLVDPPYHAGGAGGMEYPTLITAGTSWLVEKDGFSPEMVIIHEFGHQYWYGMSGNNEFEEAWLDEGMNTYSTSKIIDVAYGDRLLPFRFFHIPIGRLLGMPRVTQYDINRLMFLADPNSDAIVQNAWEYISFQSYGVNSYARTALAIGSLENLVGTKTFARIMQTFFRTWRWKHPTTRDFQNVAEKISGQDLSHIFHNLFMSPEVIDFGIQFVRQRPHREKPGVYDVKGQRIEKTEKELKKKQTQKEAKTYDVEVIIRRYGAIQLPVSIEFEFKDGKNIRKKWDGKRRWIKYTFTNTAKLNCVRVDPERHWLTDINFVNNSWCRKPKKRGFLSRAFTAVTWSSLFTELLMTFIQ